MAKRKNNSWITKVPIGIWLWILVIINCVIGFNYSPITQLRTVRVTNIAESDQKRIKELVEKLYGTPTMQLNSFRFLSQILDDSRYEDAQFYGNIFGRGVIKLKLKNVVAQTMDGTRFLANDGSFLDGKPIQTEDKLPYLAIAIELNRPSASLASAWESGTIASLCSELVNKFPDKEWTVVVNENGTILAKSQLRAVIRLGTTEDLDKKLEKLVEITTQDSELFSTAAVINLISYKAPMMSRQGEIKIPSPKDTRMPQNQELEEPISAPSSSQNAPSLENSTPRYEELNQ